MKKMLRIAGLTLLVVFLLLLLLPYLFRGKIAEAVQQALNDNIQGRVLFQPDNLSLSLISSFPDFRIAIRDFGIINEAPFEGDTLFYASEFAAGVDLLSVIGGGQMRIGEIFLGNARIRLFVLPDGSNNYTIFKSAGQKEGAAGEEKPSPFSLKIDSWEIQQLEFQYLDAQTGNSIAIRGLDHSGSGDFSENQVAVNTKTRLASLSVALDSVQYLSQKQFASDFSATIDQHNKTISFGENYVELNAFRLVFAGDAGFGSPTPKFNLTFSSPESSIKGLISLIPGVFTKDFEQVKADGKLSFDGHLKGTYDSLSLPDFRLSLNLEKGEIQYPGLPQKIEKLQLNLALRHPQGGLDLLKSELKSLSLQLGRNPFQASGMVEGIANPRLSVQANGRLDLAELSKAFPVEGIDLRGLLDLNVQANGKYDAVQKEFPQLKASFQLKQGYVKSKEFPEALEALELDMSAVNTDGKIAGTSAEIRQFSFRLAGEPFSLNASFRNPDDLNYRVQAKGTVDLGKITRLFPLEGMQLSGRMKADIAASGILSDVQARRYNRLPTSGTAELSNFVYKSADLREPVQIERAMLRFSPEEMQLTDLEMKVGKSEFSMEGSIRNHLGYAIQNETLQGRLKMTSALTDANQLMALSTNAAPAATEKTSAAKTEPLPANLDLEFSTVNKQILYDNMVLENASGNFTLQQGVLAMKNLRFQTLDGDFQMDGSFDPRIPEKAGFSYRLKMQNTSIPKAWETFTSLRKMAPVAQQMEGRMNAELQLKGQLDGQMSPVLPALNGSGTMRITEGKVKEISVVKGINSLAKTSLPTSLSLKDVQVKFTIADGRVNFEPFDVKAGSQVVNIGGSNGLDGTVDYRIRTGVPAGPAGTAVSAALSSLSGKSISSPKEIKFEIAATGQAASPKFRLVKVDAGSAKEEAKAALLDKAKDLKAEAEAKAKAEAERLKKEAEAKARNEAARLKKEVEDKAKNELENLKKKFKF